MINRVLRAAADLNGVKSVLAEWTLWVDAQSDGEILKWSSDARNTLVNDIVAFNNYYSQVTGLHKGAWALKCLKRITMVFYYKIMSGIFTGI